MSSVPDQPSSHVDNPTSLNVTGLQTYIVTGIILQLLREHFTSENRIENQHLKKCLWVPMTNDKVKADPAQTRIAIEPAYNWNLVDIQRRPALMVKRAKYQLNEIAIGLGRRTSLQDDNLPEAGSHYVKSLDGGYIVFCVANNGGTAEVLASEVARYLYQFAPIIKGEYCFKDFNVSSIEEVQVIDESSENFAVPIVLRCEFEDNWVLYKQEPRFKGVSIATDSIT